MKHFIITIFLAHFLLAAFAQNNVTIQAVGATLNVGQEITYPIIIKPNGNSVGAFSFEVEYDNNLFQILNLEGTNGWSVFGNPNTPGTIKVAGYKVGGQNTIFQAVNLRFRAIGQAGQTSQIQLSEGLVADSNNQTLNHQLSNGSISINGCNPLGGNNACKADLVVNCGNVIIVGNTMSVGNVVVTNSGNAEAPYSFIGYYLSSDANITSSDYYLGYDYVPALGEGSTSNENISIDLSTLNISEGTYYLGILADFTRRVDESNETNNTCFISSPPVTIQNLPPQGTINVTAPNSSDTFAPGNVINIKWTDNISENLLILMQSSDGGTYTVASSTASDGNYSYIIPTYVPDGQYRIYARSTTNNSINDFSSYFTIQSTNLSCGNDANTLLLLPFDNTLEGIDGETPVTSSAFGFTSGKYSNALNVNSTNPSLSYAVENNLNPHKGTLEAWVKPAWNGNDGKGYTILSYGGWGGIIILKDGANNLRLIMNLWSPSGFPEIGVAKNISDWQANQWKHVAFTWGDGKLKLYIDGSLAAQQTYTVPLATIHDSRFQIGEHGSIDWKGAIDHLRISKVVRSQAEIQGFMNNCGGKIEQAQEIDTRNYPNPFTHHTTIEYILLKDSPVTLTVYDASGKQVTVLHDNETRARGTHTATFEGSLYPAGMYYYTIQAGEYFGTQKMILMK